MWSRSILLFLVKVYVVIAPGDTELKAKIRKELRNERRPSIFLSIVNGYNAPDRPFYVQLGIETKQSHYSCGGALVSQDVVVTAAHCIYIPHLTRVVAYVGDFTVPQEDGILDFLFFWQDKTKRDEIEGIPYPYHLYVKGARVFDIAVVKLKKSVSSSRALPVCNKKQYSEKKLFMIGMGQLEYGGEFPTLLKEAQAEEVNLTECSVLYHTNALFIQICARGLDESSTCLGDSGGPLFVVDELGHPECLYGITNYGVGAKPCKGNAVYMRASYFREWIEQMKNSTV